MIHATRYRFLTRLGLLAKTPNGNLPSHVSSAEASLMQWVHRVCCESQATIWFSLGRGQDSWAHTSRGQLNLGLYAMRHRNKDYKKLISLHELAHLLCPRNEQHGAVFQERETLLLHRYTHLVPRYRRTPGYAELYVHAGSGTPVCDRYGLAPTRKLLRACGY